MAASRCSTTWTSAARSEWFTSMFPVRIELKGTDGGESLKSLKEQLRRIPSGGLTCDVLRYLSSDPHVREQLAAVRTPDVSFNYIGQYLRRCRPSNPARPERGGRNRRARIFSRLTARSAAGACRCTGDTVKIITAARPSSASLATSSSDCAR